MFYKFAVKTFSYKYILSVCHNYVTKTKNNEILFKNKKMYKPIKYSFSALFSIDFSNILIFSFIALLTL